MKAIYSNTLPVIERWDGTKGKLKQAFNQVFTLITGYEIMFPESRKDLIAGKSGEKF